ncbi:MAG: hypothetical protein LBL08_02615, partial [Candidatus Nomurabacteria bacterium]|nr:hypothetical protein [Candidatus Nomurabacteria bacterium]
GQLAYDYTFNQVFDQDEWDTVYNDKLAELNGQYSDYDDFLDSPLISLSGVTVPAALAPYLSGYTVRDLVDNSADITGDIEDARQAAIDAAQGVKDAAYNYADGISNCNQLSTGVERFACNLVGLNNYKNDLKSVADGVYNVAVSAANTAATSATNALAGFVTAVNAAAPVDPGDPADFSGLARAYADLLVRAPAEAEAGIAKTAAEAAFDQAIAQIKTQIDNLRAEVKAYVDEYIARAKDYIRDAIAEIEAYADKVAEWADQTWNKILTLDSGLTLTATTTHLASGATGSSTESYTIGDIVDAINGKNKALFENNYALTLPASIFDGVNSCTLASLNACSEITLNHQFTLDFDLPALTLEGFTIPEIAVPLLDFDELKIDLPYIGTVNLNNLLNNRIQAAVANLNNQLGLTGGYTVGDITFGGLHRVLATADSETWVKLVKPAAAVIIDNGGEQPISEVVDELTAPSTGMQLANDNAWLITLASLVLLGSAVVVTRKFATEK